MVAYRLALPPSMSQLHDVFHVSMLRKYVEDSFHVLPVHEVEVSENVQYEEPAVAILDRKEKILRNKVIPLVAFVVDSRNPVVASSASLMLKL